MVSNQAINRAIVSVAMAIVAIQRIALGFGQELPLPATLTSPVFNIGLGLVLLWGALVLAPTKKIIRRLR